MEDSQHDDEVPRLSLGDRLSRKDVERLEARLRRNPRDRDARVALLVNARTAQFLDRRYVDGFREHDLWLIENVPTDPVHEDYAIDPSDDPEGHAAARRLWIEHVERGPQDASVLQNAALFLAPTEEPLARSLLDQAERLRPSDPFRSVHIGSLLHRMARRGDGEIDKSLARDALTAFQRALKGAGSIAGRAVALEEAAEAALDAGELALARRYAQELLDRCRRTDLGWMDGNAIYSGHSVLGRIALSGGDIPDAERELLEAGHTPGSPQLDSFGPDFELANALLQRGRTEAVLAFLESCKRFWKEDTLQAWIGRIQRGERPVLERFPNPFREE